MPRFKPNEQDQMMFLPIIFHEQIIAGTFEYALNDIIDKNVNLTIFYHHYNNDEKGSNAYDPAILLKAILYAYLKRNIIFQENRSSLSDKYNQNR